MENFEDRLKRDAAEIRAEVSPELDDRIRASLEAAVPTRSDGRPRARPAWFWLASSLTGTVAALALIAVVNVGEEPKAPLPVVEIADVSAINMPVLDVRPAMLGSLETEFENLKGDLRKAEAVVRDDIDRLLGESAD
jgi:hypothetical protein